MAFITSVIGPYSAYAYPSQDTIRAAKTRGSRFAEDIQEELSNGSDVIEVKRNLQYELDLLELLERTIRDGRGKLDYGELKTRVGRQKESVSHVLNRALGVERVKRARDRILVGYSQNLVEARLNILFYPKAVASVLISGDTGTGKEIVARGLHRSVAKPGEPFVAVNAAELPRGLIESVLFGHAEDAFTGAGKAKEGLFVQANGGTLFLDEISALRPELQRKLRRVIEEGAFHPVGSETDVKVKVRCIVATNIDPAQMLKEGKLDEALYHRLRWKVNLLPLVQRREDIWPLTQFFINKYNDAWGKSHPVTKVGKDVLERFNRYQWPGNVRELENIISRAVLFAKADTLTLQDVALPLNIAVLDNKVVFRGNSITFRLPSAVVTMPLSLLDSRDATDGWESMKNSQWVHVRSAIIHHVLAENLGSGVKTAEALGIGRATLYRDAKETGIVIDRYRSKTPPRLSLPAGMTVRMRDTETSLSENETVFGTLLLQAVCVDATAREDLATVADVARTTGIGRATIYRLFKRLQGQGQVMEVITETAATLGPDWGQLRNRSNGAVSQEAMQQQNMLGPSLITADPWWKDAVTFVRTVARRNASILITGRTGTGKTELAHCMHRRSLRQSRQPHILDCSQLQPSMGPKELLGNVKGAFTGATRYFRGYLERANEAQTTLIIENIDTLPFQLQAVLLRVLQDMRFAPIGQERSMPLTARLIFTTSTDLREFQNLIDEGRFRLDLYHRISRFTLNMEPLRLRPHDIMPSAQMFLDRYNQEQGISSGPIADDTEAILLKYSWPGNVRELDNAMFTACATFMQQERQANSPITADLLPEEILSAVGHDAQSARFAEDEDGQWDDALEKLRTIVLPKCPTSFDLNPAAPPFGIPPEPEAIKAVRAFLKTEGYVYARTKEDGKETFARTGGAKSKKKARQAKKAKSTKTTYTRAVAVGRLIKSGIPGGMTDAIFGNMVRYMEKKGRKFAIGADGNRVYSDADLAAVVKFRKRPRSNRHPMAKLAESYAEVKATKKGAFATLPLGEDKTVVFAVDYEPPLPCVIQVTHLAVQAYSVSATGAAFTVGKRVKFEDCTDGVVTVGSKLSSHIRFADPKLTDGKGLKISLTKDKAKVEITANDKTALRLPEVKPRKPKRGKPKPKRKKAKTSRFAEDARAEKTEDAIDYADALAHLRLCVNGERVNQNNTIGLPFGKGKFGVLALEGVGCYHLIRVTQEDVSAWKVNMRGRASTFGSVKFEDYEDGIVTIGRDMDSHIILPDGKVSGEHLRIAAPVRRLRRGFGLEASVEVKGQNGIYVPKAQPKAWAIAAPAEPVTPPREPVFVEIVRDERPGTEVEPEKAAEIRTALLKHAKAISGKIELPINVNNPVQFCIASAKEDDWYFIEATPKEVTSWAINTEGHISSFQIARWGLPGHIVTIGKLDDSHIRIDDDGLSRTHVRMELAEKQAMLKLNIVGNSGIFVSGDVLGYLGMRYLMKRQDHDRFAEDTTQTGDRSGLEGPAVESLEIGQFLDILRDDFPEVEEEIRRWELDYIISPLVHCEVEIPHEERYLSSIIALSRAKEEGLLEELKAVMSEHIRFEGNLSRSFTEAFYIMLKRGYTQSRRTEILAEAVAIQREIKMPSSFEISWVWWEEPYTAFVNPPANLACLNLGSTLLADADELEQILYSAIPHEHAEAVIAAQHGGGVPPELFGTEIYCRREIQVDAAAMQTVKDKSRKVIADSVILQKSLDGLDYALDSGLLEEGGVRESAILQLARSHAQAQVESQIEGISKEARETMDAVLTRIMGTMGVKGSVEAGSEAELLGVVRRFIPPEDGDGHSAYNHQLAEFLRLYQKVKVRPSDPQDQDSSRFAEQIGDLVVPEAISNHFSELVIGQKLANSSL